MGDRSIELRPRRLDRLRRCYDLFPVRSRQNPMTGFLTEAWSPLSRVHGDFGSGVSLIGKEGMCRPVPTYRQSSELAQNVMIARSCGNISTRRADFLFQEVQEGKSR